MKIMPISPTEIESKTLPKGKGEWKGYDYVYVKLRVACDRMGRNRNLWLTSEHVHCMAVLGCGHEETMKAELMRLRDMDRLYNRGLTA